MEHDVQREHQAHPPSDGQFRSGAEGTGSPAVQPPDAARSTDGLDRPSGVGFTDITVEEYYARYLRRVYPYHNEEAIQATVQAAMRRPSVRENLANMLRTEVEILQEDPAWTGGWLRGESSSEPSTD